MTRRLKFGFALWLPLAAMLLLAPVSAIAQTARPAPVTVTPQKDGTRVVIEYSRLTAYRARGSGNVITVNIDNDAPLLLPKGAKKPVGAISASVNDGITALKIAIDSGATFKDYRLDKKIVIDVFPPKEKTAEAQKPAEKKPEDKKTAEKKPEDKKPDTALKADEKGAPPPKETPKEVIVEKPPEPVKTEEQEDAEKLAAEKAADEKAVADVKKALEEKMPASTQPDGAKTMPAAPVAPVIVDIAPPEAAAPVAPQVAEPTTITLSTVEPARLAVFQRFDTLWVVIDTEAAGATPPAVSGPEAGLLGNARLVKFKGGTAYRYALPPNRFLAAEKENMTWRVLVTQGERQVPVPSLLNVVFDDTSGKARLMAELKDGSKVMEIQDPAIGDMLQVIATSDQSQRVDIGRRYAELEIIPAAIGMVARPLSDSLKFNRIENFVLVTAPNGLTATPGATAGPSVVASNKSRKDESRLFDFPNWRQGGIMHLYNNARDLQQQAGKAQNAEERTALLMKLALLYFANNFGHEALGVLRIVQDETPDMVKNPNFIALRGAAAAMAGHYADALKDLSYPAIQQHGEVNLWIGYAAAASEQWRMANRSFPADNYLLLQYPENIAVPFTIYMAESALRLGKTDTALSLLASLDTMQGGFDKHYEAAINYLKGEAARQNGRIDEAIKLWLPVAAGLDRLYHTKASLAMTNLKFDQKMITAKQAIEDLDSLRFAWRGDGLEVQILHNLGRMKVLDKKYLAGLEDMKVAAKLSDDMLDDSTPIRDEMARVFADLFVGGKVKDMAPLEAVSVYNGFGDLMPDGEAGAVATLNFADSLISMDLLDRAASLLDEQLRSGYVAGSKVPVTQNKLAAVYLLDSKPQDALNVLGAAGNDNVSGEAAEERMLLRARALSQLNRTDEAIAALSAANTRTALKLKADVLWRARRWADAAATIETLLPSSGSGLSEDEAQMVVNAAVAWKLAPDAAKVAGLKSRYGTAMEATSLGSTFGVVTRTGGRTRLADRDTLMKIADEVDMFKGFLDTYKAAAGKDGS